MGGSISGLVFNTDKDQAHYVKAFMVSSLFGKFKDVLCLIPVKSLTAEQLTHATESFSYGAECQIYRCCCYNYMTIIRLMQRCFNLSVAHHHLKRA